MEAPDYLHMAMAAAVMLAGLLAAVAGMLKGIRRDAKAAAESASAIREMQKSIVLLQGSTDRLWMVLTGKISPREMPGKRVLLEDWDEPKRGVAS